MTQRPTYPRRELLRAAALAIPASIVITSASARSESGFASVRRGKIKPGVAPEVSRRVRENALPVLKSIAGFRAYYMIVGADDTITVVSVYGTKAAAEASNARIVPWIREHLGPLMAGPLEASEGTVLVTA